MCDLALTLPPLKVLIASSNSAAASIQALYIHVYLFKPRCAQATDR